MSLLLLGVAVALFRLKYEVLEFLRTTGLTTREEVEREIDEFVSFYSSSPVWWLTSLIGTLFAATIGRTNNWVIATVAFLIFVGPAIVYYYRYRPFGLKCTYVSLEASDTEENACYPEDGEYTVTLQMKVGQNITDYRLDVHLPPQVSFDSTDLRVSSLDEDRNVLYGVPDTDEYTEILYLRVNGSIPPDGESVLIKSQGQGSTLEVVQLYPN